MPVPKTFLVGVTQPDLNGLNSYLKHTDQEDFMKSYLSAMGRCSEQVCLVSFFAKLCYKSLVLGKNANVSRVRDVQDNFESIIKSGHGSVLEHVWLNFITTNCSRVFTHELVRHRVGTAFSQTSGRYVAIDQIEMVLPPEIINQPWCDQCDEQGTILDEKFNARKKCPVCFGHKTTRDLIESTNKLLTERLVGLRKMLVRDDMDFATKKRLTSAIRRLAPNGQTNEIGWSCNVRSLRHMIEMRTSRHAEWEIRVVFAEVAELVHERWPLMLFGGTSEVVDGIVEWKGLKL